MDLVYRMELLLLVCSKSMIGCLDRTSFLLYLVMSWWINHMQLDVFVEGKWTNEGYAPAPFSEKVGVLLSVFRKKVLARAAREQPNPPPANSFSPNPPKLRSSASAARSGTMPRIRNSFAGISSTYFGLTAPSRPPGPSVCPHLSANPGRGIPPDSSTNFIRYPRLSIDYTKCDK